MNSRRVPKTALMLGALLLLYGLAAGSLLTGCATKRDATSSFADIAGVPKVGEVKTLPTPTENIAQAKSFFTASDFSRSIIAFQKVLVTNPNQEELSLAYAGIGWSKVKQSGSILDGKEDFRQAYNTRSTVQDARVGLAAGLAIGDQSQVREAITILESFGRQDTGGITLTDPSFTYRSELGTGVSSGRVHALLGALYYENNQDANAKKQLEVAKQQDPDSDRVKGIDTAILTLGY